MLTSYFHSGMVVSLSILSPSGWLLVSLKTTSPWEPLLKLYMLAEPGLGRQWAVTQPRPVRILLWSCDLNVCVSSKFPCLNPNSPRWWLGWGKLWDTISPESRALMGGINALIREIPQSSVAACTKWGHKERSETLKNVTPLAPWSWAFSLQNCKKSISVVYESPSLWPLVTVARMDWETFSFYFYLFFFFN